MKRRNFLRTAGATAALTPFFHKGFAINPLQRTSMFGSLGAAASLSGKIMVFIELTSTATFPSTGAVCSSTKAKYSSSKAWTTRASTLP
jgi:hypothetical protein